MRVLILFFIILASNCNSKKRNVGQFKCEDLNKKYLDFVSERKMDSAFFYLDKTIECDSKSDFFKFEKVKLYASLSEYQKAYDYIDVLLGKDEPTYMAYKGSLGLKLGKEEADSILKKAYDNIKTLNTEKNAYDRTFYQLGLDNYFLGKDHVDKEVLKYKQIFKDTTSVQYQSIGVMENIIASEESKEAVLYKMFNID